MYERIVVPLDGSLAAEAAIPYARLVPSKAVRLVYAAPARTDVSPDFLAIARTKLRSSPEEVERIYLERAGAALRTGERAVECRVRLGDPAEEIIAASSDADLVVMASVHLGNGRLADGSVADRVIRHGTIPTIVVRANGPAAPARIARVVVPVDGSDLAESALPTARRLCSDFDAPLHLVRVVDPGTALDLVDVGLFSPCVYQSTLLALNADATLELAALRDHEAGSGVTVTSELRTGSPAAELLGSLRADDLVVMTSHGAGGTAGWCIGGVAEKLLRRAPAPILILHHRTGKPPAAEAVTAAASSAASWA